MFEENKELAPLTTFGVKAKARLYARVNTVSDLKAVLERLKTDGTPYIVLGGGSNVLFTKDYDGCVIQWCDETLEVTDENDSFRFVRLGAGRHWTQTVNAIVDRGWAGLENLAGIPGTVGGAVVQNIGAYGVEIVERISSIDCWDAKNGCLVTFDAQSCDYGYRTSAFKTDPEKQHCIVLSVTLALPKRFEPVVGYKELAAVFGDCAPASAKDVRDAVLKIRARKLPDPAIIGSAGSFFKNPIVSRVKVMDLLEDYPQLVSYPMGGGRMKLAAGWLIETAGFKGVRRGDAGVYERQALVLVNHGEASGAEIWALAHEVMQTVSEKFDIELTPEPVIF